MSAIALYALGVVGSIGQLRASHVDLSQGFGLIPLERHLRVGISTMLSSGGLLLLALLLLIVIMNQRVLAQMSRFDAWKRDPEIHGGELQAFQRRQAARDVRRLPRRDLRRMSGRSSWPARARLQVLSDQFYPRLGACLIFASAATWPIAVVPYMLILSGLLWNLPRLVEHMPDEPSRRLRVYMTIWMALTLGWLATNAYFRSAPLPHATVTTDSGARASGALIAVSDGVVYLGTNVRGDLYRAIPGPNVARLAVQRRRRIEEPSILQMLGLNFPRKRCLDPVHEC